MANTFNTFLKDTQVQQQQAVAHYHYQGQKVWLKKASKRHSTWIYLPLRYCAKIFGLHMLMPVPNTGGPAAIQCEVARIQELRDLGIRIPEILAVENDAFLMLDAAHAGQKVNELELSLKQQQNTADKLNVYAHAIQALSHVHAQKTYLSEAFARNILVDQALNFSFIDFETDPGRVLSLQECQSRDWLCFIFSTARCFEAHELTAAKRLLVSALENEIDAFQDVCRVGDKLKWILKLKPEKLGSDGQRLNKAISLMAKLQEDKPLPML